MVSIEGDNRFSERVTNVDDLIVSEQNSNSMLNIPNVNLNYSFNQNTKQAYQNYTETLISSSDNSLMGDQLRDSFFSEFGGENSSIYSPEFQENLFTLDGRMSGKQMTQLVFKPDEARINQEKCRRKAWSSITSEDVTTYISNEHQQCISFTEEQVSAIIDFNRVLSQNPQALSRQIQSITDVIPYLTPDTEMYMMGMMSEECLTEVAGTYANLSEFEFNCNPNSLKKAIEGESDESRNIRIQENKDQMNESVHASLSQGMPVGLTLCTAFFKNKGFNSSNAHDCPNEPGVGGIHAVAIIGQRCNGDKLEYLIQNSWGNSCAAVQQYTSDGVENQFDCNQDQGNFWVDEDTLERNSMEFQVFN